MSDGPSPELRARVLSEVSRTPVRTRTEHRNRITILVAVGIAMTLAIFFGMGGFFKGARPIELVGFTAGTGLLASIIITQLSAFARGSMLGRPRNVLLLTCFALAPTLAIVAFAAAAMWPERGAEEVPRSIDGACAAMTLFQGIVPLLFFVLPRRRSDPVHPAVTGAALGMTAGAWTAMMAYLRCPHASASHCVVAHVLPMVVLAVVGALLGQLLLKIRA